MGTATIPGGPLGETGNRASLIRSFKFGTIRSHESTPIRRTNR